MQPNQGGTIVLGLKVTVAKHTKGPHPFAPYFAIRLIPRDFLRANARERPAKTSRNDGSGMTAGDGVKLHTWSIVSGQSDVKLLHGGQESLTDPIGVAGIHRKQGG